MSINQVFDYRWIFAFILIWLPSVPALALDNELLTEKLAQFQNQVNTIEIQLKDQVQTKDGLLSATKSLNELNNKINLTIVNIESENKKIVDQISSLGEAITGEPEGVKEKRNSLQKEKINAEKWLSQYRVLVLHSEELLDSSRNQLNILLANRLLHKGPSAIDLTYYVTDNASPMAGIFIDYIADQHGLNKLATVNYLFLIFIVFVSLLVSLWLRSRILIWSTTKQWGTAFASRFFQTFSLSTARYLPPAFFTATLALVLYSYLNDIQPAPFIALLAYVLPFFIFSIYTVRLFLFPRPPARLFLPIPEKIGRRLAYKCFILAVIGLMSVLFIAILHFQNAPQQFLQFWQDVYVSLAVVNLIWLVIYSRHIPLFSQKFLSRIMIILALLLFLILELVGYRNLVYISARICAVTAVGFIAVIMLHRISNDFYDGLDSGVHSWHKKVRAKLGLKSKQPVPGLTIVRLITLLLLWGGFVFFVVSLLDFSGEIRQSIATLLVQGINLGDLNINPSRILLAIVIFSALYTLTSWIKVQLEKQWLSKSRIERGAKDALVTVSGYIGVALAVMIALSIAGVTFTNFAIIAGALSVGIGFGLQNIVNNFVSGLILLFERPIKNGDWIIVGSTEGYVKKISIRSTQIQTFDRADIIVPNSELVSTQVTNWMLYDRIGRIRIPVGVAYGSNTEKVQQLLYDVAMAHPNVIKDSSDYKISVFFLRFGDSSLDFELRCFIEDIDKSLTVKSELNFAIDKTFRDNDVEIPFPQRDIHVRSTVDSAENKNIAIESI